MFPVWLLKVSTDPGSGIILANTCLCTHVHTLTLSHTHTHIQSTGSYVGSIENNCWQDTEHQRHWRYDSS